MQHCHRCAAQVPVHGAPLSWCPRCGGVLSAPRATAPWTTRWVAHPPPGTRPPPAPAPSPLGPTPRYDGVPRWGLPTRPWRHPLDELESRAPTSAQRAGALAASARPLLRGLAVVLTLAAAAEAWRYALLLRGRTELLSARTVALSDSAVTVVGLLAPVLAVVTAVVVVLWLVRARQAAAQRAGVTESRSTRAVVLGALLPVVNLAQAGVLLTELQALLTGRRTPSRLVRAWWVAWVASGVLAALTWAWRAQGTPQAQADAVVLAGLSDVAGAVVAGLSLVVVGRCTALLDGAPTRRRRWVASVPSPVPVPVPGPGPVPGPVPAGPASR